VAITPAEIQFRNEEGGVLRNGRLNNLFPDTYTNGTVLYQWVEVWMVNSLLTLTTVRAWLTLDLRGCTIAIGYDSANGVIDTQAEFVPSPASTMSFSSPTTRTTGLVLPNMAPTSKLRIAVRRTTTGSTPAAPESNRLWVGGESAA
jgi:hypothetical protein